MVKSPASFDPKKLAAFEDWHFQQLPVAEKYLIAATDARVTKDNKKAIEAYENLLKVSPNNARIQFDLASLYERAGDLVKAQEHFTKAVALDPKYVEGLIALGRTAIRRRPA